MLDFLVFFGIAFKVTKVTTESYQGYYWVPKIAKNGPKQHNKLSFVPKGQKKNSAEGQSPPQELEVSPHSGPYLVVIIIWMLWQSCKESNKNLSGGGNKQQEAI